MPSKLSPENPPHSASLKNFDWDNHAFDAAGFGEINDASRFAVSAVDFYSKIKNGGRGHSASKQPLSHSERFATVVSF